MLKKLRLKIILAIVLVAAVMLGAILGLFYTLTKQNLRTQSISMMQAIAQTHGGSVWAESETGVNTFFAELPMRSGYEKRQEVPKKGI